MFPVSTLGFLVTLLASAMTVAANLLLRKGLAGIPEGLVGLARIGHLIGSASFAFGLVFYAMAMLPWLWVLSREPLGSAYPILVGTTFVLLFLGTSLTQGEPVTAWKLLGAAMIVLGIALAGKG